MADRIIQSLPPGAWVIPAAGPYYSIDDQGRAHLVLPASATSTLYTPQLHVPPDITGPLKARITFRMASATSGNINLSVAVEAIADADNFDTDAGSSFATANASGATAVPGTTAGRPKTIEITLTNDDSIAPGEMYRLALTRPSESNILHVLALSLLDNGG